MYLTKKTYIGNEYKDAKKQVRLSADLKALGIEQTKLLSVTERAGYWRKANQIHKWFVDNIQGGNDDCGEYSIDSSSLQKLLDTVKEVIDSCDLISGKVVNGYSFKDGKEIPNVQDGKTIKDPTLAKQLLPVTEGFFFGSAGYDEWYYHDLVYTRSLLTEILNDPNIHKADYYYSSSW
jgi:hypothetical protein